MERHVCSAVLVVLCSTVSGAWGSPPATINVHGALTAPDGSPLTGARAYVIKFFNAEVAGGQLGGDLTGTTTLSPEGLFNIAVTPPAEIYLAAEVWYELAIDTDVPADGDASDDVFPARTRVHSVPFAHQAAEAEHVAVEDVGNGLLTDLEFDSLAGLTSNVQTQLDDKATMVNLTAHTGDTANPHGTDATQVGLGNVNNTSDLDKPISTAVQAALDGKLEKTGQAYIVVDVGSSAATNAANLRTAYTAAKGLTPFGNPLSASNRGVVLLPPGQYDLGSSALNMDANYVDLVGLSTSRNDQYLFSAGGVLDQTANDVHIENLTLDCTDALGFFQAYGPSANWNTSHVGSPPGTVIRNCEFKSGYFCMRVDVEYAGLYEDCTGGNYCFGEGSSGVASGVFTNCTAGERSFGSASGTASGTFTNCTGGLWAFGAFGTTSGTFTNCAGGNFAFGGGGTASGVFTNCTGGDYALGGSGGTASGTFTHCTGGLWTFGGFQGAASGRFTGCTGGDYAFGGGGGTATGTFTNCIGGGYAFGGSGTASGGKFYHCVGGALAFTEFGTPPPVQFFCVQNNAQYAQNN